MNTDYLLLVCSATFAFAAADAVKNKLYFAAACFMLGCGAFGVKAMAAEPYASVQWGQSRYNVIAWEQESMPTHVDDKPSAYSVGAGLRGIGGNSRYRVDADCRYYDFGTMRTWGTYASEEDGGLNYGNTAEAYTHGTARGYSVALVFARPTRWGDVAVSVGALRVTMEYVARLQPDNGVPMVFWTDMVTTKTTAIYGASFRAKGGTGVYLTKWSGRAHGDSAYSGATTLFFGIEF